MRKRLLLNFAIVTLLAVATLIPQLARAADSTSSGPVAATDSSVPADGANAAKAHALVDAAINMTNSDQAVKLLWQATDMDPTLEEAYVYLGLYYNSRSDFGRVVQVYQRLVKYQPREVSAYLNIGEAYMSFTPPKLTEALPYYRKALELDPNSSFAALRLGEIYAQQGPRDQAIKYLKLVSSNRAKNPDAASEADRLLRQMGAM
jgi:tetratricopeptide (TPR) repeat protein